MTGSAWHSFSLVCCKSCDAQQKLCLRRVCFGLVCKTSSGWDGRRQQLLLLGSSGGPPNGGRDCCIPGNACAWPGDAPQSRAGLTELQQAPQAAKAPWRREVPSTGAGKWNRVFFRAQLDTAWSVLIRETNYCTEKAAWFSCLLQ